MPNGKNRQLTLALAEYERLGEPDQAEKSQAWQTAIGLQQVDGLATSKYLLETAKEHIEGRINIDEAQARIDSYYQTKEARQNQDSANTREADIVASRIAKLLAKPPSISQPLLTSIFIKSSSQAFIHTPERFAPTTSRKKNGY